MRLERLSSSRTARGPLFCPRCCWRLGRAESPAIGYLTRCGGCRRSVRVVEIEGGDVAVVIAEANHDENAVYLELER